jgi:hypothetical protein
LVPAPYESSYSRLLASAWLNLGVAFATIHWPALSRLEGHFTFLATLNTYRGMHLAGSSGSSGVVVLRPLCLTASRATLGLISVSPTSIELLLLSGKGEFGTTVRTLQRFVRKSHWMTSFLLKILGSSLGHPTFANGPGRALTETWQPTLITTTLSIIRHPKNCNWWGAKVSSPVMTIGTMSPSEDGQQTNYDEANFQDPAQQVGKN